MSESRFIVLLCFVILLNTVNGETYFINKKTGNDSNSGLSPTEAWENIEKVNGFTFSPGDSVLFSRGSTWHSTFCINSSGTEGNPIYYGAYGEGRKPTFDMLFYPGRAGFFAKEQKYGIIENIVFKNSNGDPPNHADGIHFTNSHNFIIRNIEVYGAGNVSLTIRDGSSNFLVDSVIVMNGQNNGIYGRGNDIIHANNLTIENSYVSNIRWNDNFVIHQGDNQEHLLGENFIFRNNYAEKSLSEEGFDITAGTKILLDNNITIANKNGAINIAHSARNVTITNHISYADKNVGGSGRMILSGLGDITLKGNLIFGHQSPMLLVMTSNINISHNTFVWEDQYSDGIMVNGGADSVVFKNNILSTADEYYGRLAINGQLDFKSDNFHFDYNIYFGKWEDFIYGSSFYTLATWQNAFNQESNSVVRNPYFVDKYLGNFTLSDSSWAIDNADSSSRFGEVDMLGTPIPYGNGADIGAFEFKPGVVYTPPATPPAPDNLTIEMLEDGKVKLTWNDNSDNEFGFHIWRTADVTNPEQFIEFIDAEGFIHLDFTEANAIEYIDSTATIATVEYRYRIKAINNRGNSAYTNIVEFIATDIEENLSESIVTEFVLLANYPNPFNPSTTIEYQTPTNANVKITIYNVVGELVKTIFEGNVSAGSHSVNWNAEDRSGNSVTSGVYFYRISASARGIHSETGSAQSFINTKKMLLLK
ncbi:MAG: T9SS type A sorting domain-containing protein [Melioribacteraceae bacterium]|nr:T9SS type A sorting domain-containing protein [Melioribacteraceae bacterium]